MKIAICLLVTVLVVSIDALSLRSGRSKRGFRNGAADRFSHGFGKRMDLDDDNTLEDKLIEIRSGKKTSRGFRNGAADRFSHGFGKRMNTENDLVDDDLRKPLMDYDQFVKLMTDERFAMKVAEALDRDGDGYISPQEIVGGEEK